jgi:hypothetical protein
LNLACHIAPFPHRATSEKTVNPHTSHKPANRLLESNWLPTARELGWSGGFEMKSTHQGQSPVTRHRNCLSRSKTPAYSSKGLGFKTRQIQYWFSEKFLNTGISSKYKTGEGKDWIHLAQHCNQQYILMKIWNYNFQLTSKSS